MTRRADFNAEDWTTIVNGPMYAGLRVVAADRGGTLRETLAMSRVYESVRADGSQAGLLGEIVATPPAVDGRKLDRDPDKLGPLTVDRLQAAMRVLEATATTDEVDAYKTFVMTVAQAAASAHREGGVFGIGGRQISDAENAALDEVSSALGAPPPGATPSPSSD